MTRSRDGVWLAIESSTSFGSVALADGSTILGEMGTSARSGHSSSLLPAIENVMSAAAVERSDLRGLVVGSGPGSFTGIRIAGAAAKGIVRALGIPLYTYSSLLATAVQAWASSKVVCSLADARGRDVYAAAYRFGDVIEVLQPPIAMTLDAVVEFFGESNPPIFIGEGARRHAEELEARTGGKAADGYIGLPRAAALLWLVSRWPASGLVDDIAGWQPDYVRQSGAERIAAEREARASTG